MAMFDRRCSEILSDLEIATRLIIDQLAILKLLLMHATLEEELDSSLENFYRVLIGLRQ
jgi:hypothetical protein